jgi:hypothetical protein
VLNIVTLSEAKGLGEGGYKYIIPILTPRFFVTSFLRMTFDTTPPLTERRDWKRREHGVK